MFRSNGYVTTFSYNAIVTGEEIIKDVDPALTIKPEVPDVSIVGGGLAGLVAAIAVSERTAKEENRSVTVYEAAREPGGRARTLALGGSDQFKVNNGPHALYGGRHGHFLQWLKKRQLLPSLVKPPLTGFNMTFEGKDTRSPFLPLPLFKAALKLRGQRADDGMDFRTWASQHVEDPRAVEAAVGFASLPSFHHDPGDLSAKYVDMLMDRVFWGARHVRYVEGGWSELVSNLVSQAAELGVKIETESRVTDLSQLPESAVILAVPIRTANELLDRSKLVTGHAETALLDVSSSAKVPGSIASTLELNERVYASRVTAFDPTLAPPDRELIQASAGLRPGETLDDAVSRMESVIDRVFPHFLDNESWRRQRISKGESGAIDFPAGTSLSRPNVVQSFRGRQVLLTGDGVNVPGLLSEVSWRSAIESAKLVKNT